MAHSVGQGERAQAVVHVVGERVQLKTHLVVAGVPLHLGHDAAGLVPAVGPVAEAGVEASYMIGRTANRSREQVRDAFLRLIDGLRPAPLPP